MSRIDESTESEMIQNIIEKPIFQPRKFDIKFALSAPYHYFLTRVEDCKETHDQIFSVSLHEVLDVSLGEIVDSLHINFMIEIGWLCSEYLLAAQSAKMTIVYGLLTDPELLPSSVKAVEVEMPSDYGCHHSKISILKYKDGGIRIIISTANLYFDDWKNRTQGLWVSPHLPQLPDSANPGDGDSCTGFKKDFRKYLAAYRHPYYLLEWQDIVKRADFSAVNVFFIGSIPGIHKGITLNNWGHRKLSLILSKYAVLPPNGPEWTLIAQCSSIGSFGPNFGNWLTTDIIKAMSAEKSLGTKIYPDFQLIYPSVKNYMQSFDFSDSTIGSCCLPYTKENHAKQEWIKNYMYQWKSENNNRTKAVPHIKSYTRVSPDQSKIPWFILTSANLSKGAWGSTIKNGTCHAINNYEAGVVFIPQVVIGHDVFPIKESDNSSVPIFPIPYDLPLTCYGQNDEPFVREIVYSDS